MAFQLSAGVNVSEIDLTTVVPSVSTSIGAFAGPFAWGPANTVITVSDEVRLTDVFGKPDSTNYEYWFSAANFLAYSNNLKLVRAINTGTTRNATGNTANSVLITNDDSWDLSYSSGSSNTYGVFAARYAGAIGNSLRVSMADAATFSTWTYATLFNSAPGTSNYASKQGGSFDEMHVIVIDEDGLFSGQQGTVLEKYSFVSKGSDSKDDSGNSNYYKNIIADRSKYIHWMDHPYANGASNWGTIVSNKTFANLSSNVTISLTGGVDGTVATGNVISAYDLFDSTEAVDISR